MLPLYLKPAQDPLGGHGTATRIGGPRDPWIINCLFLILDALAPPFTPKEGRPGRPDL